MKLLLLLATLAQAPSVLETVPVSELTAYGNCIGEEAVRQDRPELSPEQVADAATTACEAHERAIVTAQMRLNSALPTKPSVDEVRRDVRTLRERNRASVIASVGERRGVPSTLDTVSTRSHRYGLCLGGHVNTLLGGAASAEAIVNAAFLHCAELEQAVMALAPPMSVDQFNEIRTGFRTVMRDRLLNQISEARAAR